MKLKDIVPDAILKFKSDKIKAIRDVIGKQLIEADKSGDTEKLIALQKKYNNLSIALGLISKKLGNRILL